jgi:hypothetical protein
VLHSVSGGVWWVSSLGESADVRLSSVPSIVSSTASKLSLGSEKIVPLPQVGAQGFEFCGIIITASAHLILFGFVRRQAGRRPDRLDRHDGARQIRNRPHTTIGRGGVAAREHLGHQLALGELDHPPLVHLASRGPVVGARRDRFGLHLISRHAHIIGDRRMRARSARHKSSGL